MFAGSEFDKSDVRCFLAKKQKTLFVVKYGLKKRNRPDSLFWEYGKMFLSAKKSKNFQKRKLPYL